MPTPTQMLPPEVRPAGTSAVYTEATLPDAERPMRSEAWEWLIVQVDHGRVRVKWGDETSRARPGDPVLVPPTTPFRLEPEGAVRLRLVRYRRPGDGHASHLTQR